MKAKDVSIESYINKKPMKRKNSYGLYISPFRDERNPSFKIDYDKNLWYDYGAGEGGSVIDLVMKLEQCNFSTACEILENGGFSFHRSNISSAIQPHLSTEIIDVTTPFSQGVLMQYCISRGISGNIVCAYLRQIHYVNNNREYYSLGMQNVLGGWEIVGLNHFKMVIGNKAYSIIKGECSNELCIFEGIFDFLSSLMIGNRKCEPQTDCIILHSVTTLRQTKEILNQYDVIHSFLDNDEAGEKCHTELLMMAGQSKVITYDFYQEYKDINDYLLDKKKDHD